MIQKNKILGALAGMILGDAMGMPGELWPKEKIYKELGYIDDLKDGLPNNEVSCYFKAGQFTDDSSQALVFLDILAEHHSIPEPKVIAKKLLEWVNRENGFEKNLLGTSSKAALLAHLNGKNYEEYTAKAESNGAAMRIAPLGCIIASEKYNDMAKAVYLISKATHSSDVTIAGAAMIAQAVSSAIDGKDFNTILNDAYLVHDIAIKYGEPTYSASCKARLQFAVELAKNSVTDEEFLEKIYTVIGSGLATSESIPAAIAIAYYAKAPEKAAILSANLGGDTDTIGAMATAICGAYTGIDAIRNTWIKKLEDVNNIQFSNLLNKVIKAKENFRI